MADQQIDGGCPVSDPAAPSRIATIIASIIVILGVTGMLAACDGSSELDQQLVDAVRRNQVGEIERLIAEGADVNYLDDDGETVLHEASFNGHESVVQTLVAAGADVNIRANDGETALHAASFNGRESVCSTASQPQSNSPDSLTSM